MKAQQSLFKKQKKKLFSPEQKIYGILGFCVFVFLSILIGLLGPFFKVQNILIESYENIEVININQAYDNINAFRKKNIFILDTEKIKNILKRNQNTIQEVYIQKNIPNTLTLTLIPYNILFQTQEYFILENGVVVPKDVQVPDILTLKVSEDLYDVSIFGRKLKTQELENISLLKKELEKNILGFSVKTLYYLPTEREILVENALGNIFIFNIAKNISEQITRLSVYSKEGGNVNERKYIYIDVRIPQKLFLCEFESEFLCRKNLKDVYGETIFEHFGEEASEPQLSILNVNDQKTLIDLQV